MTLQQENTLPFNLQISIWLWFTVLFANFSEAIAEGRGKAQAESLKKSRVQMKARKLAGGKEETVWATDLKKGDIIICEAGKYHPCRRGGDRRYCKR